MEKLLASLIGSFLLLRDLFGYLIPGALFTAMMLASFRLPLLPQLLWVISFPIAAYAAGHILVALGYAVLGIVRALVSQAPKTDAADTNGSQKKKGAAAKATRPAEGATDTEYLFYRHLYPQLFIDADRRETLTILRIGLGMALLAGPWWLPLPTGVGPAIAVIGAFMVYNGGTARAALRTFRAQSVAAAKLVERKGVKPFAWAPAPAGED